MEGADAVIHLGGISIEKPFEQLVGPNLAGTFNVFEAARLAGASRVVFASSNHATGFYPVQRTLIRERADATGLAVRRDQGLRRGAR